MIQRRKYYARIAMCVIAAVAAFLLASRFHAFASFAGQERQPGPVIRTDKSAYLAGETIRISGQGYPPLASVMVQVTHADGTAEGGMGHVPFFIAADTAGSFDATWTINETETAGAKFIVTAVAPSASDAVATFERRASLRTRRFGQRVIVEGSGFNPNELLSITIEESEQRPEIVQTDGNGAVNTSLKFEDHVTTNVEAISAASGLVTFSTISFDGAGFFQTVDNVTGADGATCPAPGCKDDVPLQSDLTRMGRNDSDSTLYKIFWSWNSVSSWTGTGQTGDACALFDTGGDNGKIDFAICAQVTNNPANPSQVIQTPGSPFAFNCSPSNPNQRKTDRCANPTPISASAVQLGVKAGVFGTNPIDSAGDLITDTDPFPTVLGDPDHPNLDTTIEVDIKRTGVQDSILPAGASLANVCSFPSAGNGGNNNPFDCIVRPASGFLVIVKNAGTGVTSPTFTFDITKGSSTTALASPTINGSGQTNLIPLDLSTSQSKYTITERSVGGWDLQSVSCTSGGSPVSDVANRKISSVDISSAQTTTCTFTNARSNGTLKVIKSVINSAGGSATASDFSYQLFSGDSGAPRTAAAGPNGNSHSLADGTAFNVQELNGATPMAANDSIVKLGVTYKVSYSGCSGTIAAGTTTTCTITNTAQKASPSGATVLSFVLHDKLTITGLRANAPDSSTAAVTFNVYSNNTCSALIGSETDSTIVSGVAQTSTGITILSFNDTGAANSTKSVWVQAVYSGDQYNNGFTTPCTAEKAVLQVTDDSGRNAVP